MSVSLRSLFCLSVFACAPAWGDLYMEFNEKSRTLDAAGNAKNETSGPRWVWIGENSVRNDSEQHGLILHLDQRKMYVLNKVDQNYIAFNLDEVADMVTGMALSITDSGETRRMNDGKWQARKFDQVMQTPAGPGRAFSWVTEDIELNRPELLKKWRNFTAGLLQGPLGSPDRARIEAELAKQKGLPLVSMSSIQFREETIQTMQSLTAFAEAPAPPGTYDVPANLAELKIDVPQLQPEALTTEETQPAIEEPQTEVAVAAPPTPEPAPEPATTQAPAHNVAMIEISDENMGYKIRVPEGYQTLRRGKYAHTFSLPLPGGLHEYNVNLVPLGANDMGDAVHTVTLVGGKKLIEKKQLDNGYWIIKAPRASLQEIWVFLDGPTSSMHAKCTGPASDLAVLIDMCSSLQATK